MDTSRNARLRRVKTPLTLPFDLSTETGREELKRLRSQRKHEAHQHLTLKLDCTNAEVIEAKVSRPSDLFRYYDNAGLLQVIQRKQGGHVLVTLMLCKKCHHFQETAICRNRNCEMNLKTEHSISAELKEFVPATKPGAKSQDPLSEEASTQLAAQTLVQLNPRAASND